MTAKNPDNQERLLELLADRALQGLAHDEHDELGRLLVAHPEDDPWALDWTAAAIDLPWIEPEPLPASVRAKVERDAVAWLARAQGLRVVDSSERAPSTPAGSAPRAPWWPWLLAAACLAVAALAWWPTSSPSIAEQYARLANTTTPMPWTDVLEAGVSGDLVWDNTAQTGVMRFSGLAANDPARLQYQLWIFDASRGQLTTDGGDAFNAVDGGVFDVERAGDVVYIKVNAKLDVVQPTLFAVTTEPPGGVVKHIETDDYRIVLTAAPFG